MFEPSPTLPATSLGSGIVSTRWVERIKVRSTHAIACVKRPSRAPGRPLTRRERQLGAVPPAAQPAVVRGEDDRSRAPWRAPPPAPRRGRARRGWSARRAAAGPGAAAIATARPSRRRWPTDRLPTGVRWSRGCSSPSSRSAGGVGRSRTAASYVASAERVAVGDRRVLGELADGAGRDVDRASGGRQPAGQHAEQRRLARPVGPGEQQVLPRGEVEPRPPASARRPRASRTCTSRPVAAAVRCAAEGAAAPAACAPARARPRRADAGRPSCAGRGSARRGRP